MREAYSDIFLAREDAQTLTNERIKGILATKVDKGDAVLDKMATTFRTLASLAKWDLPTGAAESEAAAEPSTNGDLPDPANQQAAAGQLLQQTLQARVPQFAYNIQIQLPATKDISVYNAIFKSIREHLL